jgi:hypothetical protein
VKPDDIEFKVCERLWAMYGERARPLIADIEQRQAFGLAKYPTRLAENPAPLKARLRHLLEELLDGAVYTEWCATGRSYMPVVREYWAMQQTLLAMAFGIKDHIPDEEPTAKPREKEEVVGRTAQEIVDQTNELARELYRLRGYVRPRGYRFDKATHPQEVEAWNGACEAQLLLTQTDVDDALQELDGELDEEGGEE